MMAIEKEFDKFFEFPTDDKSQVSSTSCKLFAAHIANLIRADEKESQWISVDDKHPERIEGSKILGFGNGYIFECEYEDGNWCNIGGDDFTHWMPLPNPPTSHGSIHQESKR